MRNAQRTNVARLIVACLIALAGVAALSSYAAPRVSAQSDSVVIQLSELNASGVSGAATFTDNGGTTNVLIAVKGATGGHPTYIHEGTCDSVVPTPSFPLVDVDASGGSETDVDVALTALLAGQYALIIHNSIDDLGTYLACGDIVAGAAPQDGGGSTNPPAETTPAPSSSGEPTITVKIGALNSSGISGTAELTADGDKTNVVIQLTGDLGAGGHPAHIHSGGCKTLGGVVYPLADVDADGYSETTINAKLDVLLAKRYALNIHKSSAEIEKYIACGNIRKLKSDIPAVGGGAPPEPTATVAAAPPANEAPTATAEPETKTPATGVGFGASHPGSANGWIAILAAIAATLLGCALAVRSRTRTRDL